MQDQALLQRITFDPKILAGKPVIRGTRLSVEYILNLRAHGASEEETLAEYSGLTTDEIHACYLLNRRSVARYRVAAFAHRDTTIKET